MIDIDKVEKAVSKVVGVSVHMSEVDMSYYNSELFWYSINGVDCCISLPLACNGYDYEQYFVEKILENEQQCVLEV